MHPSIVYPMSSTTRPSTPPSFSLPERNFKMGSSLRCRLFKPEVPLQSLTYLPRTGLANIDTKVESGNAGIDIKHSKDTEPRASYILVSNCDNNAICIAQIALADLSVQTSWAGDMGKFCGMVSGFKKRLLLCHVCFLE